MSILDVIMPAYNEEGAIRDAVAEVQAAVLDRIPDSELLVVNDGSRDSTGEILDELVALDPRVSVVHKPNGGHGSALIEGLARSRAEWVFLIDSDRQMPLEPVATLWDAVQQGSDAAFGVRRRRDDPRIRRVLTRTIRRALPLLFGVRLHDANVPYKLFRRETWLEARPHIPDDTLAPSLFLAVYMRSRGLRIAEIDIEHRERETGEVSIRRWKLIKFCGRAFGQLLDFRRSLRS
ncbi:MAG: glycosyltransferase family 2 protein [Gemmatimonadetes bacterium]|nr:glycosyltransferase family 2 protein [Gemmatimonadota bacterium]